MSELESTVKGHGNGITASRMLSEAREAMGLSQKDIADQLFLTKKFISCIDEGDLENFPKKAFLKGYLRSYARIVDLSGDEIIERYEDELHEAEKENTLPLTVQEKADSDQNQTIIKSGLFGLAVLILVIIIVWLLSGDGEQQDDVTAIDEAAGPGIEVIDRDSDSPVDTASLAPVEKIDVAAEDGAGVATLDGTGAVPTAIEEFEEMDVLPEMPATEATSEAQIARSFKDIEVERSQERDVQYIILRAGGQDELEFLFQDECWVEIEDGEGDLIYTGLNQSGDVLKVFGIPPFNVLFGKASVVSVQLNGEKVNLASRIRSDDTARLSLGG